MDNIWILYRPPPEGSGIVPLTTDNSIPASKLFSSIVAISPYHEMIGNRYKEEHFAKIRMESGFENSDMLFYDDHVCFLLRLSFLLSIFGFMIEVIIVYSLVFFVKKNLLYVSVRNG